MGAQTPAHRYMPTPRYGYPKSECYLWCRVTGKALGFLLFQAGFDRAWSKTICSHQGSAHVASSACMWVQPQPLFTLLMWMLKYKWSDTGWGVCEVQVPVRAAWADEAQAKCSLWKGIWAWLSVIMMCLLWVWATVSLTTLDVDLARSCSWSDLLFILQFVWTPLDLGIGAVNRLKPLPVPLLGKWAAELEFVSGTGWEAGGRKLFSWNKQVKLPGFSYPLV